MVSSEINFKLKVSDWRKEPTDDIAVRRKKQTGRREACSGVLIVDFSAKWSCVFLSSRYVFGYM